MFDEGRIELHPGARIRTDDFFLADKPLLSWEHLEPTINSIVAMAAPGMKLSVFFIDFGPSGDIEVAHKSWEGFRFVHSLWTGCFAASLASCRAVVPWRRPGNPASIPNRYTFFLIAHPSPLKLLGQPLGSPTLEPKLPQMFNFNLTRLVEENPGLVPVGYTYMSVSMPEKSAQ